MSQVTQPRIQLRSHRAAVVAAVLALAAIVTVALVLIIGGDSGSAGDVRPAAVQQSVRPDGGPDESDVATAVGSRADTAPAAKRPDESRVASAITGH